jgi:hypothetical protein
MVSDGRDNIYMFGGITKNSLGPRGGRDSGARSSLVRISHVNAGAAETRLDSGSMMDGLWVYNVTSAR